MSRQDWNSQISGKNLKGSYKQEMVRDAFINGIISQSIRQRLLENVTLSLDTAFTQARSLELAEKSSNQYNNASSILNAVELDKLCNDIPSELNAANTKRLCFFCGGTRHNHIQCQAICHNCEKTGHFAKVCQSKSKLKKSAAAATYPTLAVTLATSKSLVCKKR